MSFTIYSPQSPNLLLFDLGGVLIRNDTFEALNRLLPVSLDIAALKHRWLAASTVREFELGRLSPLDFATAFISEWQLGLSPEEFLAEFSAWPVGPYPEVPATLGRLRKRYRIGCFSNSNVLHWEKFRSFRQEFDVAISSHLLGAIKPDEEAFALALELCGEPPSTVYFFDDSMSNVDAASRLGIRSFRVDGFHQLVDILQSEKLLTE